MPGSVMAAIEDGMYQPSMKDRMAELEGEKRRLDAFLSQSPEGAIETEAQEVSLRQHAQLADDKA